MTQIPAYRSVLVPTDLSERAARALPHAYALVVPGGTIHVMHVLEGPDLPSPLYAHYGRSQGTPEAHESERRAAREQLEALVRSCPPPQGVAVEPHVVEATSTTVVDRLCRAVQELGVDVVCVVSHGRGGLGRALLGSVAHALLQHCPAPTLVVRVPAGELDRS